MTGAGASPPLLVLHAYGAPEGGAPWRAALHGAWDGPWSAPDLPGHGDAPWEGDCYERTDLVIAPLRHLRTLGWDQPPIVAAVGEQATAAELLALGGRAAAIALVADERPEPVDAREALRREYAWLRGLADDPAAGAAPPSGRTDPRTRHRCAPCRDAGYAALQRGAITVPVLVVDDDRPDAVLAALGQWRR